MNDPRQQLELQLSAYLDNELDRDERRAVEALLATDENARALLEQLQATAEAVRALPRLQASDQFVESLRARMERQSLLENRPLPMHAPVTRRRSYFRWTAAAAVLALTVTAGYLMWSLSHERFGKPNDQYALVEGSKSKTSPEPGKGVTENTNQLADAITRDLPAPATGQSGTFAAGRASEGEDRLRTGAQNEKGKAAEPLNLTMHGQPRDAKLDQTDEEHPATNLARGGGTAGTRQLGQGLAGGMVAKDMEHLTFGGVPAQLGDKAQSEMGLPYALAESTAKSPTAAGKLVPPPTAVVELSFADADSQQEAMQLLREEYSFQPAAPPARTAGALQVLAKQVPDQAGARDVVASVERSLGEAKVRVIYSSLAADEKSEMGTDVLAAKRTRGDSQAAGRASRGREARPATAAAPTRSTTPVEANRPAVHPEVPSVGAAPAANKPESAPADRPADKAPAAPLAGPASPDTPSETKEAGNSESEQERAQKSQELYTARRAAVTNPSAPAPTTEPALAEGTPPAPESQHRVPPSKSDRPAKTQPAGRRLGGGFAPGPGGMGGMGGAGSYGGGFGSFGGAMGKATESQPAPDGQEGGGFGRSNFAFGENGEGRQNQTTQPADGRAAHVIRLYVWVEPPTTQPSVDDAPTPTTSPASQPAPAE